MFPSTKKFSAATSREELSGVFWQDLKVIAIKFMIALLIGGAFLAGSVWNMKRFLTRWEEVRMTQQRIFADFEALAKLAAEKERADELWALAKAGLPQTLELVDNFPKIVEDLAAKTGVRASVSFLREPEGMEGEPKYMEVSIRADGSLSAIIRFVGLLEGDPTALRITDFRIFESPALQVFQLQANGRVYVR
jgi:hypothetical protein